MRGKKIFNLFWMSLFCFVSIVFAQTSQPLYPGFPSIQESSAYDKYLQRDTSSESVLIYLIDRFSEADVVIEYAGFRFTSKMSAALARLFLAQNYEGQSPEKWILQWCHRAVPGGEYIHVELPDGSRRLSKEILMEELANLNSIKTV